MKRLISVFVGLLTVLSLASCGESSKTEETTVKTDWRNTIEYEGSFYVNEGVKMLYALDRGSITLWDNGGEGVALQTINYDTSVSDAIERIEKSDFNGDSNTDIRIIYSESEEGTRYNLFLWSEKTGRFAECRLYNEITDPVIEEESGYVVGVWDMGPFGIVTKKYSFNENSGLDLEESVISEPDKIAVHVAAAIMGEGMTTLPASGKPTIENEECEAFIVFEGSKTVAYIAHTAEGQWYIDKGTHGIYREVIDKDGEIALGDYLGECKSAYSLAVGILSKDVEIYSVTSGRINDSDAKCYVMESMDGERVSLANDKRGFWYLSEDGEIYIRVNASTGDPVSDDEFSFAVNEE